MSFIHPAIPWLLEKENPGVHYLAIKDLTNTSSKSEECIKAKKDAYAKGPIGEILKNMKSEGYWERFGAGYNPKYRSTVWSLILLSQLGALAKDDERIAKACRYYLDHAFTKDDSLSYNGTPSGTINCLEGNMCVALAALNFEDERLIKTYEWMAKSVLGNNIRYYAYSCGPCFACGANGKKPCAWGAVKILLAFGKLNREKRTSVINDAIEKSVAFFFSIDPVSATYPTRNTSNPSRDWWKFGFPVFYITDLLQLTEALVSVGYGSDPRLKNTIDFIMGKQDKDGRWMLEYDYAGKTWGNYGKTKEPNKWVTYRALKLLKTL